MKRLGRWVGIGVAVIAAAIQLVPYGGAHTNPTVREEPAWDPAPARELAVRACFDCHSNETRWPWYSHLAPVSWLIQHDVDEGRRTLNFSEWDRPQKEARESAREVQKGKMPPWYYPWARLSPADRDDLIRALAGTAAQRQSSATPQIRETPG